MHVENCGVGKRASSVSRVLLQGCKASQAGIAILIDVFRIQEESRDQQLASAESPAAICN